MADAKISALTDAGALDGTELLLLSQSGADAKLALSDLNAYASGWVRPTDWLPLSDAAANSIKILVAITDDASNYVAVSATVTGGFTVDWGDGSTPSTHSSAATAVYQYNYADADLVGTGSERGYRQAILTITPTTGGNNITAFNLGLKHTATNLNTYTQPWLDVSVNCSAATSMTISSTAVPRIMEHINFVAIGAITTLASAFLNCIGLQSIEFPSGSLASVTSLSSAFNACYSLKSIEFPSGSLASVTTLVSAFVNCIALQSIEFPSGSLASVTTLASAFQGCVLLQSIEFPSGSLASVTTLASAFNGCNTLKSIDFPAGSLASVTALETAFNGCNLLQSIVFPSGSLASVTNLTNTFQNCLSLKSIVFPSGALVIVVTTTTAFNNCSSLSKISGCAIPVSFSVASCELPAAALDEIYTALPSVTATITVSTNVGTATDDPTIATAKGWTVTGS